MVFFKQTLLYLLFVYSFALGSFGQNKNSRQRTIDSLYSVLPTLKLDTNKVNAYIGLEACLKFQDAKQAMKYGDSAIQLSVKLGFKRGEAIIYRELGLINADFVKPRNYPEAISLYNKALKIFDEIHDENNIALCYNYIGRVYYNDSNYPEAIKYFFGSLKLCEKNGDKVGMASNYGILSMTYTNFNSQQSEAIKYRLAAAKIYEELNFKGPAAFAYKDIGALFNEQGNYAEALTNLYKSLKFFEDLNNPNEIASTLRVFGSVYNNLNNYEDAMKMLQLALSKAKELRNDWLQADIYSEIGNTYHHRGNFQEALNNYNSALKIYDKDKDKYWSAGSYMNMARVYRDMTRLEPYKGNSDSIRTILGKSLKLLSDAKKIFEDQKAKDAMAEVYRDYGSVLSMQALFADPVIANVIYREAIDYFDKAIELAKDIGTKKVIRDSYGSLAEIYAKLGDYKKAIEYTNIYMEKKDSLFNNETANKIEQLKMEYEKEKTTTQLQYEFSKKEDSIKYQKQLAEEKLNKQILLSLQQSQELQLKQASLDLSNKQKEVANLEYLKAQAELRSEQSQRLEQEKELSLKETQIQFQKRQLWLYIGGSILIIMFFFFNYHNIKNKQKAKELIAAEKLKSEKANTAHKMAELELQSLRAQLNPHFMFNSLNAIQELILKEDTDNSHLYLSRFSELLRMLLDNANQPFVSLRKEISLLELYLSLENLRIPDLKYTIELDPSIDSNRIAIPNMMLQPYIENAIWHGLSHKKGERNLNIRISKKGDSVVCEVEDNGVGRKMSAELKSLYRKEHRSRGMELLSKRFTLLSKEYGSDIQTTIEDLYDNGSATGTRVAITVPYSLTEQAKPVYS